MKKDNKLKKIIQASNPEIMKLQFGCEVDMGQENQPHYVIVIRCVNSNHYTYDQHTDRNYEGLQDIIEYKDNFTVERTPIGEIYQVLGRPIRLDDVALIIKDRHWLIDNWRQGYLDNQTDIVKQGIIDRVDL